MDGIIADYRTLDVEVLVSAAKIASRFDIPMFYLRVPKKHGLKLSIEGDLDVLKRCKDVMMISRYKNGDFCGERT